MGEELGGYLKAVRHFSAGRAAQQDWTTSSADVLAARAARNGSSMAGMAGMQSMDHAANMSVSPHAEHTGVWGRHSTMLSGPHAFVALDTMVMTVSPLHLANPVLISPPMHAGDNWSAKSDTRDRPLRVDLILDAKSGAVLKRTDFHSKPWLDRAIGVGIAAHEGQLFGALNQLVSLFTTAGLVAPERERNDYVVAEKARRCTRRADCNSPGTVLRWLNCGDVCARALLSVSWRLHDRRWSC